MVPCDRISLTNGSSTGLSVTLCTSRSARAEAQAFLTDAASREQQFLVDRRAYAASIASLNVTPPADLAAKFTFTIATADGPPPTFTVTGQAIGEQVKDQCPTITLDNTGNRTPAGCW